MDSPRECGGGGGGGDWIVRGDRFGLGIERGVSKSLVWCIQNGFEIVSIIDFSFLYFFVTIELFATYFVQVLCV